MSENKNHVVDLRTKQNPCRFFGINKSYVVGFGNKIHVVVFGIKKNTNCPKCSLFVQKIADGLILYYNPESYVNQKTNF